MASLRKLTFRQGPESIYGRSSGVIKKIIEAAVFMAIGAALFAANPRAGQRGGLYVYSCTAGLGLQWAEGTNQPVLLSRKPKLYKC